MNLTQTETRRNIYIFALSLLAASLPFSLFMLSIGLWILFFNWAIDKDVLNKFKTFFTSKPAVIFSLLFLIHIVGLIYTTDFHYAFKDIRTKIPLLLIPLVIFTTNPLSRKELQIVLSFFIAAVITATFICTTYYFSHVINDIREISRYISHIRFGLMICFAIVVMLYYLFKEKSNSKLINAIYYIMIFWLIIFLFLFESVTGISILAILLLLFLIKTILSSTATVYRITSAAVIVALFTFSYIYIAGAVKEYYHKNLIDFSKLETNTAQGNPYFHDTTSFQSENGNLIWVYINKDELAQEWKKRSRYDITGYDEKNQYIEYTLIRFLASKGLRKDAEGVKKLSDDEIVAIEKGIPSISFFEKMTLKKRIHQILWEYENYMKDGNANGLSVMLRVEFVKTSLGIISEHPIFGVGTGDVNTAFKSQYEKNHSLLKPEFRWRSHNQYLSFLVAFGVIGFLIFMSSLLLPPILLKKFKDYRYLAFFIIIIISMLTEDTLETQVGVTFFAFFNALFIFGTEDEK